MNNYNLNDGWNSLAAEMLYACMHDGAPEKELSFYEKRIRENEGPALDQACGTGRHLFPLLKRGLEVHGADSSEDAIKFAHMKADELGVQPKLFHQRMEEMDLPYKYGTIYITNGTFQVFYNRETAVNVLLRIRDHLFPGGEILIEIGSPESLIDAAQTGNADNPTTWIPETRRYKEGEISAKLWIESIDQFEQIVIGKRVYDVFINGKNIRSEMHTLTMTYFYKNEFVLLLEKAGFSDIKFYSDYTDKPADRESECIIYSARNR